MKNSLPLAVLGISIAFSSVRSAEVPAEFVVTDEVVAQDPQPFGLNMLVGSKGFNNVNRSGTAGSMEPEFVRAKYYVNESGTEDGHDWFTADNLSQYRSLADGYWRGATARIYRREGDAPYRRVATDTVHAFAAGRGFWCVSFGPSYNRDGKRRTDNLIRADGPLSYTDGRISEFYQQTNLRNGTAYYYVVRAMHSSGVESDDSQVASAIPDAGADSGPRIITFAIDDTRHSSGGSSRKYSDQLESTGGAEPLSWSVVEGSLPDGLTLETVLENGRSKGRVSGTPSSAEPAYFTVKAIDGQGRFDTRRVAVNLPYPPEGPDPRDRKSLQTTVKPEPPVNVKATPGDGSVTITWGPSPTPGVVGYSVWRSKFPPQEQVERVVLAGAGGRIAKGDLVFLDVEKANTPADESHDRVLFKRWERAPYKLQFKPPASSRWQDWKSLDSVDDVPGIGWRRVPHPGALPDEFADRGSTCLELSAARDWGIGLIVAQHNHKDQEWYNVLLPGRTYRFEAWMRQEGIPQGAVSLADSNLPEVATTFTVDGTWRKHQWEFSLDAWEDNPSVNALTLAFSGGGRLWLDTPVVYDATDADGNGKPDVPAGAMLPDWKNQLKAFYATAPGDTKGVLRFWGGQSNGPGGATLVDLLAPPRARRATGGADKAMSLGDFLRLCEEVNADPWIIMSVSTSEEEWAGLVDYLAGSADSKYTRRRTIDRGGAEPWTDTFEKIYVECDNETWNGSFAWNFRGREGVPGDRAADYGSFAEMLFRAARSHPAWSQARLDGRIEFIVNGWNTQLDAEGYGAKAAAAAPSARFADVAPYLGGWEQRTFLGGKTFADEGLSQWLLYMPWRHQQQVDAHTATAAALRAEGLAHYRLAVYEGGPGYDLPGPSNPSGVVPESYGKSLAAAVTTLDCYLYESLCGYGPQAFFGFRPGTRWSSHVQSAEGDGFTIRPQTTYLALAMRNRYATGPMVRVRTESVPSIDLESISREYPAVDDVPLVACYAFSDGRRCSVFLLSRRLDKRDPAGEIVEPAITPATLRLPFKSAERIVLHQLSGDPRGSNVPGLPTYNADNFGIVSRTLPTSALKDGRLAVDRTTGGAVHGAVEGLPPGSVYLYVFDEIR